jgi:branched-subunit amino acid aminotransferase/4-amino-4-deoxychorismate lyase
MEIKQNGIVLINGKVTSLDQAQIPLTDRGFLFGHALFETILVYRGKIIHWKAHFDRLKQGCTKAFLSSPDEKILFDLAKKAVDENIKRQGSISEKISLRIMVTGGNSLDLPIQKKEGKLPESNVMIICRNATGPSKEQYENGIKLWSCLDFRNQALLDVKSNSYLFNLMCLENARLAGFDDALFHKDGFFTESTTANFIWFDQDQNVYSAPFDQNCLAGTTLSLLVKAFEKNKISFAWKALASPDLISGCALVSSIRGILPIKQIDQMQFDVQSKKDFFDKINQFLREEYSNYL